MGKQANRFISLLMMIVLLGLTAIGCASNNQGASNTPAAGNERSEQAAKPLELDILSRSVGEIPDMKNQIWTEIQRVTNTNLKVNWIPDGDYSTKIHLTMASGDLPEIMVLASEDLADPVVTKAIKDGVFWDLGPLLGDFSKYPNLKNNIPEVAWTYSKINGKNYVVPRARPLLDSGYMFRKDLFDKNGLPLPQTMDELKDSLKTIIDNDESKQLIGIPWYLELGSTFGNRDLHYNDEGGLIYVELNQGTTDLVKWYREVYAAGLMSQEFALMDSDKLENLFSTGQMVVYRRNSYNHYRHQTEMRTVFPDAEVTIVPAIAGPKGHAIVLGIGYAGAIGITKDVPEEKVLQILDLYNLTASEEVTNLLFNGIEGVHYNMQDNVPVRTEMGHKEINNALLQFFANKNQEWSKVDAPAAPHEYNLKMREVMAEQLKVPASFDPFLIINSDTWSKEWPRLKADFLAVRTKAIMGIISMEEYEAEVDRLNALPELKQAYKEFEANRLEKFGQ